MTPGSTGHPRGRRSPGHRGTTSPRSPIRGDGAQRGGSSVAGESSGAARASGDLLGWAIGALVLLAVLGAAGPATPVTAAAVLPPPDTSAVGATGQRPDPTPVSLPSAGLPGDPRAVVPGTSGSGLGIPGTVLAAYRSATTTVDRTAPSAG